MLPPPFKISRSAASLHHVHLHIPSRCLQHSPPPFSSRTRPTTTMATRQEMDKPVDVEARFRRLRPVGENDEDERYCICRGFDEGAMIACDGGCNNWFHLSCIGMKEKEQEGIDKYICSSCVKLGRDHTIYKPGVAVPVSSRYHYVTLPPAANQAVSKQDEYAKLARLLQEGARSRQASKQLTEQPKTKAAGKQERTIVTGLPSASRVNPDAKTLLKPMRKKHRPQMRRTQGIATSSSSLKRQAPSTPRQKPSSKQQGDPNENTPSIIMPKDDGMSDDEMSVDSVRRTCKRGKMVRPWILSTLSTPSHMALLGGL